MRVLPPAIVLSLCVSCVGQPNLPPPLDGSSDGSSGDLVAQVGSTTTEGALGSGSASTEDSSGAPTPAECGNGIVELDEECDDSEESTTCDTDCTIATCGDGTVNSSAGEECDDREGTKNCNPNCTFTTCGDGVIDIYEDCDDGRETLDCDSDCTWRICGDSHHNQSSEECDNGGVNTTTCDFDCTLSECGDNLINPQAGEECEGSDLQGESCISLGAMSGTLVCNGDCTFDVSDCF